MILRYRLSRLSRPAARRAFGRTWLGVCLAGAFVSLVVFGVRHAFFIATVWILCIFAPIRIAIEWLHTAGPRWREQLTRDLMKRQDRYATRERLTLMVEVLFSRGVVMPRLAPPDLEPKVIEAAVRLCDRTLRSEDGPLGMLHAAMSCAALLDRWVGTIAAAEPMEPSALQTSRSGSDNGASPPLWDPNASIQDQWITLRSIAGLAALTKTLVAVFEDYTERVAEAGAPLRAVADAAMDYTDQIGLRLEGPAWEEIPGLPRMRVPGESIGRMAETWMAFCAAPLPSPRRLGAFVDAVEG
jgi:hypothetical protein